MELRLRREIEPRRGTFSQFRLNVRRTLGCRVTGGPCKLDDLADNMSYFSPIPFHSSLATSPCQMLTQWSL